METDTSLVSVPDTVTAIATAAAVIIAIFAAVVSARAYRGQRLSLIADIRSQWESIANDWALVVLYYYGDPDFYYSDAPVNDRKELRRLMKRIDSRKYGLTAEVTHMRAATRQLRRVARFFAYVAEAVLRGQLTVSDAYAVFGPDIARHRMVMYWVAGRIRVRPDWAYGERTDEAPNWQVLVDEMRESTFFDNQARIVALADLMSSEVARRGDTYAHLILGRARELEGEPGGRITAEVLGLVPWYRMRVRRRLKKQLSYSRRVRWRAATTVQVDPLYVDGDDTVLRAPWGFQRIVRHRFKKKIAASVMTAE